MKGLLIKDFYMIRTYLRITLAIVLFFLFVGAVAENGTFYYVYSCMMAGIVPISLLSYDEREHWMDYAETMPLSATTIVLSKYLLGLVFACAITVLATLSHIVNCIRYAGGDLSAAANMAAVFFCLSLLPSILLMPVLICFGVEKGRLLYYVLFGGMFGILAILGLQDRFSLLKVGGSAFFVAAVFCALWVCSLLFSRAAYPKRER